MLTNETKRIKWIENDSQLSEMITHLKTQSIIGVDTESDSLYVYYEKVCLIQFSSQDCDYLVDPLSVKDLLPLNEIFANHKIEKVFHAAEYDVMCLKRDFGYEFNNIFDSMIASRILSKKGFGLSNLLSDYFNLEINKKYQRANWGKRPLSAEMINYASEDSHYLIELRNLLYQELIAKNFLELAKEDFSRISNLESFQAHKLNDSCWKMVKGNHITPQQMSVLMELCNFRENVAKNKNIPAFKILGSEILIEIAKFCPTSQNTLSAIHGISPKILNRYGDELINCVRIGLAKEPIFREHKIKPSDAYLNRYEAIKLWRKNKANTMNVESDVILPKDVIDRIAQNNPKTSDDLQTIMADIPYRFGRYSNELLQLLTSLEVR